MADYILILIVIGKVDTRAGPEELLMSNDNPSLSLAIDGLSLRTWTTLLLGTKRSTYCTEISVGLRPV